MIGSALVIGGGIAGMSAAIELRKCDIAVTLIDSDAGWRSYGAGISLTGMSLRAFERLGVLDEIRRRGHVGAGMRGRTLNGELLFEAPAPPDPSAIQSSGGIMRGVLHDILAAQVRASGAEVRLGVKASSFHPDDSGVEVRFSDGGRQRFELVVAADGNRSETRRRCFAQAVEPQYTGQGCWRAVAPRPAALDRIEMYFGGPLKVGVNPVSASQVYIFVLEHVPDNPRYEERQLIGHLRSLLEPYGGAVGRIREELGEDSQITYRPLEWHLQSTPWYYNRIVLIGDAAHGTTPHLASGAGLAVEDALVLAEELQSQGDVEAALAAFMVRRLPRSKLVVETSVRVGEIEMAGGDQREATQMLTATMAQLQQPY